MGKSGHIGKKIAASFSSLGTPSFFLHPAEAIHGDLGMVRENDLIIAISKSGESDEIKAIFPSLRRMNVIIVGLTENAHSTLARFSDICEVLPETKEACFLGLAPSSSTTVALVYGDALAITASAIRNFEKNDFGVFHPSGSLGKKLIMRVSDCMAVYKTDRLLYEDHSFAKAITILCKSGLDIVPVYNRTRKFIGSLTEATITETFAQGLDIYNEKITNKINRDPLYITHDEFAIDALRILMRKEEDRKMLVLKEETVIGVITCELIIAKGVYV
jgi:arabinose-5-phosphate isomerase